MVDRSRVAVAALVVVVGVGLFGLGQGPTTPGGTVAPNEVPVAEVTARPGDPGTVTVRFASAGDWASPSLTVAWNDSLRVADGERRLEAADDSVTLAERAADGDTAVRVTVTATGGGKARSIYREIVWP